MPEFAAPQARAYNPAEYVPGPREEDEYYNGQTANGGSHGANPGYDPVRRDKLITQMQADNHRQIHMRAIDHLHQTDTAPIGRLLHTIPFSQTSHLSPSLRSRHLQRMHLTILPTLSLQPIRWLLRDPSTRPLPT